MKQTNESCYYTSEMYKANLKVIQQSKLRDDQLESNVEESNKIESSTSKSDSETVLQNISDVRVPDWMSLNEVDWKFHRSKLPFLK